MKKNVIMRAACVVLVLTLLSTCMISGTFAKYVTTSGTATDGARVAKWGVTASVTGSLFDDSYKNTETVWTENEDVDTITVQAVTEGVKVVAPGTNNSENKMTFTLTGTPEVDTAIVFTAANVKDVCLPAGTYLDYTTSDNATDEFTLDANYYPVVFTLKDGATTLKTGTAAEIAEFFTDLNGTYHTNTNLATIAGGTTGVYELTWAWAFNGNDKADTYLGNVIAGTVTDANAKTEVSFDLAISATQID